MTSARRARAESVDIMRSLHLADFQRLIDKATPNGCWHWTGRLLQSGYGDFFSCGKRWRAHRYSYQAFVGPIGDKHVLHRCDNPRCVNPEHLFLGNPAINALDKAAKGRTGREKRFGENNGLAKLDKNKVLEIRASHEPPSVFASRFGVSKTAINYARNGTTWSHIK